MRVQVGENSTEFTLTGSNLVGRDDRCDIVIQRSNVPLFWLEIRWRGNTWMWRTLASSEDGTTIGSGRQDQRGWRLLELTERGSARRLRCGTDVVLQMISDSPPAIKGQALSTGRPLANTEVEAVLDDSSTIPLSRTRMIGISDRGEPLLVCLPEVPEDTESVGLDLANPNCFLDLGDAENPQAVFTLGSMELALGGESVRVLMAYAAARIQDSMPEGGWLTRSEAYAFWLELGGRKESPTERIGWEKGKLRERLEKMGALNVGTLFENRRLNGIITSRLALAPDHINLNILE